MKLSANQLQAGNSLIVDADVKNTSRLDGEEVAEVYLNFPKLPGASIRALRGFTRVRIGAGKTENVRVALDPRDLSHVNEAGARIIGPGSYRLSIGGGQPDTGAPGAEVTFTITGQAELPE